jgi:capsular exopolysaccharide synthesis family protein
VSERLNDESVLRDRLNMLSRQKWIVLVAVIVVAFAAFATSRSQQHLYQASATVLVNEQNPTAAALNLATGVASPPDRYAATQATLARVGAVAQMAMEAANVPHHTPGGLLANSSVTADPNVDLLTFAVRDPVPAVAEKLATSYARAFTEYRHTLDNEAVSVAIADVRRKLKAIEASGGRGSPLYLRLAATDRDLEALQTLQVTGSSAVMVGPARGVSLVEPKTRRNVILGVLLGLAVGLGLAFLRDALDTRVHSAEEIRSRLGMPLLGQVPKPDRRLAKGWQVVTLSDPHGPATEAFRILKSSLEISQLHHDADSIAVTSTTHGEGKSAITANLAVILARSGRHVILVDLDLRDPSMDGFFGLVDRPGLTSVAAGTELSQALSLVDVHAGRSQANGGMLEVMTVGAAPPPDPGEFLLSSFVRDVLAQLAARGDVLLIDTPPVLAAGDAITIATRTDAVILVAGVNQVRRAALAEARRVLEACPALKLGFIATGNDGGYRLLWLRSVLTLIRSRRETETRPFAELHDHTEGENGREPLTSTSTERRQVPDV